MNYTHATCSNQCDKCSQTVSVLSSLSPITVHSRNGVASLEISRVRLSAIVNCWCGCNSVLFNVMLVSRYTTLALGRTWWCLGLKLGWLELCAWVSHYGRVSGEGGGGALDLPLGSWMTNQHVTMATHNTHLFSPLKMSVYYIVLDIP